MATPDEPNAPNTEIRQRILGSNNVAIGLVGEGAQVNIGTDAADQFFNNAQLARHQGKMADAVANFATAAGLYRDSGRLERYEEATLTRAYLAFDEFKRTRDKALIKNHAAPAFEELVAKWDPPSVGGLSIQPGVLIRSGGPAAPTPQQAKLGEARAYLTWCYAWLGRTGNASQTADKVVEGLGPDHSMSVWAKKAVTRADRVENVQTGLAVGAGMVAYVILAMLAIAALGYLANLVLQ